MGGTWASETPTRHLPAGPNRSSEGSPGKLWAREPAGLGENVTCRASRDNGIGNSHWAVAGHVGLRRLVGAPSGREEKETQAPALLRCGSLAQRQPQRHSGRQSALSASLRAALPPGRREPEITGAAVCLQLSLPPLSFLEGIQEGLQRAPPSPFSSPREGGGRKSLGTSHRARKPSWSPSTVFPSLCHAPAMGRKVWGPGMKSTCSPTLKFSPVDAPPTRLLGWGAVQKARGSPHPRPCRSEQRLLRKKAKGSRGQERAGLGHCQRQGRLHL